MERASRVGGSLLWESVQAFLLLDDVLRVQQPGNGTGPDCRALCLILFLVDEKRDEVQNCVLRR